MTSENHASADTGPSDGSSVTAVVGSLDDRVPGEMKLVRVGERRIAVTRTAAGVHALDNACPHQGCGLGTGSLDGDLLTCQWHNWKFRVTDGRCLIGEENVASHDVAIADGQVAVTVNEPSDEEARAALWPSRWAATQLMSARSSFEPRWPTAQGPSS